MSKIRIIFFMMLYWIRLGASRVKRIFRVRLSPEEQYMIKKVDVDRRMESIFPDFYVDPSNEYVNLRMVAKGIAIAESNNEKFDFVTDNPFFTQYAFELKKAFPCLGIHSSAERIVGIDHIMNNITGELL